MNDAARLEALEFKCAHLERSVQELSDVLYQQSQRLDEQILRNQQLRQQIEMLGNGAAEPGPAVELPPHY